MSTGRIISERTDVQDDPWSGPLNLLGVALGLGLSSMAWLVAGTSGLVWALLPPLVGAVSLVVPGPVRQFGAGLVVSVLGGPVFLFCFFLVLTVLAVLGQ